MEISGLVTGIGMEGDWPTLELRAKDGEKPIVPMPKDWSLQLSNVRYCIGFRAPDSKSLVPCPDQNTMVGAQCDACRERAKIIPCMRCKGDRCRNPARHDSCIQDDNHAVYLVAYAPGVHKVGVARWGRRYERIWEQGARAGVVVGQTDGLLARRMETAINASGIPDRWSQYDHMQALATPSEGENLLKELRLLADRLRFRMPSQPWVLQYEELVFSYPSAPYYPQRYLVLPNAGIQGKTLYSAGRLVLMRRGLEEDGPIAILNLNDLIGWEVTSLAENAKVNYQASLPLL